MDNTQKYAYLSANYIDNSLPQDETDYEVEKIVSEYCHPKWGMCYFVYFVDHEFLENDQHLLLEGEMFNCTGVLHDWKYRDANPKPKYYGAASISKADTNQVGEFWKFIEGHETGVQCMIIAVNIYFQHSFGQEFIQKQLRKKKSDPQVC